MKITFSGIKADIGSIGGHICPNKKLLERIADYVGDQRSGLIIDQYVGSTGDDVAILSSHQQGVLNKKMHKLAWKAFVAGTEIATEQDLYGAGQDLFFLIRNRFLAG